jgi:hypothetical protein
VPAHFCFWYSLESHAVGFMVRSMRLLAFVQIEIAVGMVGMVDLMRDLMRVSKAGDQWGRLIGMV